MTYLLTYLTYIPIYPASHTFKKLVTLVTRIDVTYWIKAGGVFFLNLRNGGLRSLVGALEMAGFSAGSQIAQKKWSSGRKTRSSASEQADLLLKGKTRGSSQAGVFTPTGAYWTTEAKQAPPPQPPPFNNFPPAWDQANNRDMMTMIH